MSQYVCPECGSQLRLWAEQIVEHSSNINPKTGRLTKKIDKRVVGLAAGCRGLECTKCDWSLNMDDVDCPEIDFNEDEVDRFFEVIEGGKITTGKAAPH